MTYPDVRVVSLLPPKAAQRLADFLAAAGTGTLELHVKDGAILAWTLTEKGNG